ncbi:hypothetical protein JXB41_02255 [Candidatus Woesearchaeota archaeon]|nr:hypothetical protein [Candidatus Woesearchaeota archaeon]
MYLYSNCLGTFVFNQNFKIREQILFSKEESLKNSDLLKQSKILDSEKKFLEKFKNIENLRETKDIKNLQKALYELRNYTKDFYNTNMYITKHKIRESVSYDLLIIQCINSIIEYNKVINLLVKRLREWYSYYFPEIDKNIEDNEAFVKLILKKTKKQLMQELKLKFSMGSDLNKKDTDAVFELANQVDFLIESKHRQELYLEDSMKKTCPNLTEIAGTLIGGKLIALAGSIKKLVLFPASTIQLLGAEKALFRHMRNKRCLPPKYGVLHEHKYIQQAPKKLHGKIARVLSDKISIAVKIDYFKGDFIGDKLRKEIEEKIKEMNK